MSCSQCGAKNDEQSRFCSQCGASLSAPSHATSLPHPDSEREISQASDSFRYAGFWFRTLASIIDTILTQVATFFLVFPLTFMLGMSMASMMNTEEIEIAGKVLDLFVSFNLNWLYFTISESSKWQATLGKKILGLKVVDEYGVRIGFGKANRRYWSKILSALTLCIGFLMVAFTEKKQGLHDKIARTFVLRPLPG